VNTHSRDNVSRREVFLSPSERDGATPTGAHRVRHDDGDIGHVAGLLVDDETWAIRYLIVDTSNWWLGHQVLVAPQWIRDVSWPHSYVTIALSRGELKDAPQYDEMSPVDRAQEIDLFNYYGRPGYWVPDVKRDAGAAGT